MISETETSLLCVEVLRYLLWRKQRAGEVLPVCVNERCLAAAKVLGDFDRWREIPSAIDLRDLTVLQGEKMPGEAGKENYP